MNDRQETEWEAYRRDSMFFTLVAIMLAAGLVAAVWT